MHGYCTNALFRICTPCSLYSQAIKDWLLTDSSSVMYCHQLIIQTQGHFDPLSLCKSLALLTNSWPFHPLLIPLLTYYMYKLLTYHELFLFHSTPFCPPPPYLFTFFFTFLLPSPYLFKSWVFLLQTPLPSNPMLQNTPSPALSGRITYTLFRLLVNFDFSFSVNGHLNLSCFIVDLHQTTWVHCQQISTGLYKQRIRRPLIFIGQTRVILTRGPVLFHCADKSNNCSRSRQYFQHKSVVPWRML